MDPRPLPKKELIRQVKRFLKDPHRGISQVMFSELCGISQTLMERVFLIEDLPMTETTQIRVNKGYREWKEGRVRVMRRKDMTRFVEYKQKAEPVIVPSMGVKMTSDGPKISLGMVNRRDYSTYDLDEALRG